MIYVIGYLACSVIAVFFFYCLSVGLQRDDIAADKLLERMRDGRSKTNN